jgi:hypothetical protein
MSEKTVHVKVAEVSETGWIKAVRLDGPGGRPTGEEVHFSERLGHFIGRMADRVVFTAQFPQLRGVLLVSAHRPSPGDQLVVKVIIGKHRVVQATICWGWARDWRSMIDEIQKGRRKKTTYINSAQRMSAPRRTTRQTALR